MFKIQKRKKGTQGKMKVNSSVDLGSTIKQVKGLKHMAQLRDNLSLTESVKNINK